MSDQDPQQVAATNEAVVSANTCVACKRSIAGGPYYRVGPQTICPQCAVQVQDLSELNRFAFGPWMMGAVLGLMAAIACGILWAMIVKATGYELGLAAVGVGFAVSWAAMKGAGGRRGPSIQVLAIALAIVGIVIGKGLTLIWVHWDEVRQHVPPDMSEAVARIVYFVMAPILTFRAFDLLWYGFAIWEAFRIPRAIRIPIHGPYSDSEQPAGAAGLQFDTVQPTSGPPSPPPQGTRP